jgi:hypothetical protein
MQFHLIVLSLQTIKLYQYISDLSVIEFRIDLNAMQRDSGTCMYMGPVDEQFKFMLRT